MLYWVVVLLVLAVIAGLLGFGGIAVAAAGIAKILFVVFLILLVDLADLRRVAPALAATPRGLALGAGPARFGALMLSGIHRRARSLTGLFGLFAALSALAAQLAFGASMPNRDQAALLAAVGAICHAGEAPSGEPRSDPPRHRDCAICSLCAAISAPIATLPATPGLVLPAPVGSLRPGSGSRRSRRLVRLAFHAQPRGPPLPI